MNQIVKATPAKAPALNSLMPSTMREAMELANMMARGRMVPAHFHNQPGDCLMVVEQAMRWNMSPFAVAQCTSSIQGKLMYEGKIVAAAVEHSGAIAGYMDYEFSGEGPNRKVKVTATRVGEDSPRSIEVELKDAATNNIWWKKTPDQMLVYHGARVWARRWTPGVMLGVYSPEEFGRDEAADTYTGTTIDATPERAPTQRPRDSVDDDAIPALETAPPSPVEIIRMRLEKCGDRACVLRISDAWHKSIANAMAAGRLPPADDVQAAVNDILAEALGKFPADAAASAERASIDEIPF